VAGGEAVRSAGARKIRSNRGKGKADVRYRGGALKHEAPKGHCYKKKAAMDGGAAL
jgi:hypothetical protein